MLPEPFADLPCIAFAPFRQRTRVVGQRLVGGRGLRVA
jgi:hypothetical protein